MITSKYLRIARYLLKILMLRIAQHTELPDFHGVSEPDLPECKFVRRLLRLSSLGPQSTVQFLHYRIVTISGTTLTAGDMRRA